MELTSPNTLRSCLYECTVMHHRLSPREHQFRYRIFMFSLDLDEIDSVAKKVLGFSRNRFNLYSFRDKDHLDLGKPTIRENLTAWLDENNYQLPSESRIQLVTLPRVLGYIFNPVSFYFCSDSTGAPLCAIVQVGNTFREMKPYLIREQSGHNFFRLITPKHFYVSPFSELDLAFDFKLKIPDDLLDLHIDDRRGNDRVLLSALTGKKVPLTSLRLAWLTLKFPLITLKVIALIHWQAFLLWLKRLPVYRKEERPDLQRDLYHPHASIASKNP